MCSSDLHRLAACFAAGFFVLCQVLAGAVVGLFLQPDSALFASSVSALRLYSFAFLFVGFNVVISGFFTAMEHPIPSLTISFGRGLVLISGCLVALAFLFGSNGIWLSPLVSESLCLLITLFFLIRYFRRVRREASGERDGIPDARPLAPGGINQKRRMAFCHAPFLIYSARSQRSTAMPTPPSALEPVS